MDLEKPSSQVLPSPVCPPSEPIQELENEPKYESNTQEAEPESIRDINGVKWFVAILAIISSTLLFSLDNTVVAEIQPSIASEFNSVEKLPWLGAAFILGSMPILVWGKCYGIFSVKKLYCGHVLLFEVGSAICGAAPNMNAMIVGRAIAGAGGSGMYVGCLTYIALLTTPKEKPRYTAMVGLVWGVGTVLGPLVGGAFASSSATWRWGFYINLVFGALLAPVYIFILPGINLKPNTTFSQKLTQLDWLGIILFNASMACLIMAVNFGGTSYGWNSTNEITLWIFAGVVLAAFAMSEWLVPFIPADDRLYPAHFFRSPLLVNLQVQLFLASGILFGSAYYIPLYFQFIKGDDSFTAAVKMLPYIMFAIVFMIVSGGIMSKSGYYMPWYAGGSALVLIGSSLIFTITPTTSIVKVYGYTILIGVGVGSYAQASYPVSQCMVQPENMANVIAFMGIAQALGIVIFFSIMGSVFQNRAFAGVSTVLPNVNAQDIHQALAGTSSSFFQSLEEGKRAAVISAVMSAMSSAWAVVLAGGACSFLLSLFLGRGKYYDAPHFR